MVTKDEILEQLLSDICYLSHKHEVANWKDAPGTDSEKLKNVLTLAREGLALVRGKLEPQHVDGGQASQIMERLQEARN
jgi:hypothetical protein